MQKWLIKKKSEMEKDYISLVLFTVLSQTAAGSLILREILLHSAGNIRHSTDFRVLSLLFTGIIIAFAIGTAFLHLGKQSTSVYTLRNLRNSWLSREILFTIAFSLTVLLYWFNEKFLNLNSLSALLSLTGALSGAGLIISMSAIYMLPAVPSWNSPLTPVSFVITAFTGGLSVLLLLNPGYGTSLQRILMVILSFTILLSLVSSVFMFASVKETGILSVFLIRLATGLVALITIYLIYFKIIPNKIPALTVLLTTVLLTEMAGRVIFFLNYHKSGL